MKAKGFTLVELLVAIAIIAVLAVVAYPLYNNYVKNARLSEAHQAMMDNAQALERHYGWIMRRRWRDITRITQTLRKAARNGQICRLHKRLIFASVCWAIRVAQKARRHTT